MNKQSFYKNILRAFGLVSMLYILIITGIFGYKNTTFSNQMTRVSDQNLLTVMTNELTGKFNSGISLTNSLFADERIKDFAMLENTHYHAIGVQSALSYYYSVFYSNNFDMILYNTQADMAISGKESGTRDLIRENFDLSQEEVEEILTSTQSSYFLQHPLIVSNGGSQLGTSPGTLHYIKRYQYPNDNVLFVFTRFDLKTMFHSLLETDRSYIMTCDGMPVFAEIKPGLLPRRTTNAITGSESLFAAAISSPNLHTETAQVPIGGTTVSLNLYLFHPRSTIGDQTSFLFSTDIIIMLALLLIGGTLILILTKTLYRPIQNLLSELGISKSSPDIIDEFKSVEHYLKVIRENNEELNSRLEQQKSQFQRDSLLRDLFYGIYISEDIYMKMASYGLNLDRTVTQIVIGGLDCSDVLDNTMNEITRIKLQQAISIFKDLLGSQVEYELFELSNMRFACYIFSETDISPLGKEAESAVKLGMDMTLRMCIRTVKVPLSKAGQQSLSLLELLDNALNNNFKESDLALSIKYYYPNELEQMLINAVVQKKFSYAGSLLDIILYENLNNRKLNKESRNAFIINIASTLEKICAAFATNMNTVFPDGEMILLSMKTAGSNQELLKVIKEEFNTMFQYLEQTYSKKQDGPADSRKAQPTQLTITGYIAENYTWDISLTDIAEYFNLTPAYMSYIFKENTSRNFKDYLNWYRVEQAKAMMLKNSNMLVKDVCEQVGCNSTKTFIRIFKKYENLTPNQYVETYHKNQ